MEILSEQEVIQIISASMMASPQYWKQVVVYKPESAVMHITTAHYLAIDEPNLKLPEEKQRIVDAFSAQSNDFVLFRTLSNSERKLIIDTFLQTKSYVQLWERWSLQAEHYLQQWQPWAIEDFLIEVEDDWHAFRAAHFKDEILQVLADNHVDIHQLSMFPVLSP